MTLSVLDDVLVTLKKRTVLCAYSGGLKRPCMGHVYPFEAQWTALASPLFYPNFQGYTGIFKNAKEVQRKKKVKNPCSRVRVDKWS